MAHEVSTSPTMAAIPVVFVMNPWAASQGDAEGCRTGYGGQGHICDQWQGDQCIGQQHFGVRGASRRGPANKRELRLTTICFQNIPNSYSSKMVCEMFDRRGFKDRYDFLYVPHDFKRLPALVNLGYFFVNFLNHEVALRAWERFVGFREWLMVSDKILAAKWATRTQGQQACIERFRNSPVMHQNVPAECKPVLIENGVAFHLAPTKTNLKMPRFKSGYGLKLTAENDAVSEQVVEDSSFEDPGTREIGATDIANTDVTAERGGGQSVAADRAWDRCFGCDEPFSLFRRRHLCRACGCLCCAECAPRTNNDRFSWQKGEEPTYKRMCMDCAEALGLAPTNVRAELLGQPSRTKVHTKQATVLQGVEALRSTELPVMLKNTFISLERSPSIDRIVHKRTTSFPL